MKNFLFISTILLISVSLMGFDIKDNNLYKVLSVQSGDTFCVDFNQNSVAEPNEIVKLNNTEAFATRLSNLATTQAKTLKTTQTKIVELGYLEQKFAENQLLNKSVRVKIIDRASQPIKVAIFANDADFAQTLAQEGYNTKTISPKLKNITPLNLVLLNKKSLKYHTLDCKYAQSSHNLELIPLEIAQKTAQPCGYCHPKFQNQRPQEEPAYNPPNEPNVPYFTDGVVSLYVTNPNLFLDAPDICRTAICKVLLECINQAHTSIDFATYGVEGQKRIVNALVAAQNRGVNVRWVTDFDAKGNNIYKNTKDTMQLLKNFATDLATNAIGESNASALMHNKFFVFDNKTLLAGSANLSNTDLSGMNANVFIKINSDKISSVFEQEFEQMYNGFFHHSKKEIADKTSIKISNNNIVSVYFSPKDRIISTAIIPLINEAHEYIYMPIFFLTDKNITQALIGAKQRGVEVRVIMDAVAAENAYSQHKALRAAKIPVKVEDWAGKMHQKSLIIDDSTVVIGSMNFSKSGDLRNDENCIVVQNAPELAKKYKQYFLMLYNSIPNKWLTRDPRPESPDSIGSCFDGVDNDFDEKIDVKDEGCFRAMRKKR